MKHAYLPPVRHVLVWASVGAPWLLLWLPILAGGPLTWFQGISILLGIIGSWYGGYLAGFMKGFNLGGRAFQGYLLRYWDERLAAAFSREAEELRKKETDVSAN